MGFHLGDVTPQVCLEIVRGLPQQLDASGIIPVGIRLLVQIGILDVTVRVLVGTGDRKLEGIGNRTGEETLDLVAGAGIVAHLDLAFILIGGFLGVYDNGPAYGVTAVEGALGTTQDLDLRDVKQLLVELGGVGHQDPVHQDRHRHVAVPGLGDAAYVDKGIALVLGLHQGDVRCQGYEVTGLFNAGSLDIRRGKSIHRDGNVFKGFGTFPRRDHHLFQAGRRLYRRYKKFSTAKECQGGKARCLDEFHFDPPLDPAAAVKK